MAGLTALGFEKRTLEDLLAQVEADEQAQISTSLDVSSSSPMGQINAVLMKTASELWDLAQAVYDGADPDKNSGDAQDAVAAITGTLREGARSSYTRVGMALGAAVTVPAGAVDSDGNVTAQGALMAVDGNPAVQFTLIGLEATPGVVVPGDVTSAGAGTYYGRFTCTRTGPVLAPATQLDVIVTPIVGWTAASNPLDAVPGRDVESDSDLRTRREDELQAEGTSPADALRAKLLQVPGVLQVTVFENDTDATDGNGLPPHSIECLVYDGASPAATDASIAQAIWDNKAAGIQTHGGTTANATDSQGNTRSMSFSRPTLKPVYFDVTITDVAGYPGDLAVKEALVARGAQLAMGDDVNLASFYPAVFDGGGVTDLTSFKAGFAPSPSGTTNLVIAARELATFDTGRITVHS